MLLEYVPPQATALSEEGEPSPLRFVGIGFEIAVPVLLGLGGGYWLDQRFGTKPWLLLVGALMGMVAGFVSFFRTALPRKGGGGEGS